ncbi:MAG TPA: flagellar basal body-associated FliL family protein [Spirochaetia bacterium]|nr:flagellar basal body-associated FliL family protein [Spirochaetia bacterium]
MSDEQQDLNLEDVGAGAEEAAGPRRGGLLSGMLLTILKWAAIGIGVIIIVVTTTVITVRAVTKGATAASGLAAISPEYGPKAEPLSAYDGIDQIRGQTADDPPATYLLQLSLGYLTTDAEFSVEIGKRKQQIQDLILKDISLKTADELSAPHWEELQAELLNTINAVMTTGKVRKVDFLSFIIVK